MISGIFTNHITCIHSITRYEPLVPKYGSSKRSESQSTLLQTVIGRDRVSPSWHCCDCSDFPVIYEPSLHFNGADQKLAGCMLISNIDQSGGWRYRRTELSSTAAAAFYNQTANISRAGRDSVARAGFVRHALSKILKLFS